MNKQGLILIDRHFEFGEIFGEMALYPGEVSPITTTAESDVELVVISAKIVVNLIQANSKFASEIIQFIEERKKSINFIEDLTDLSVFSNDIEEHQKLNSDVIYPKWLNG